MAQLLNSFTLVCKGYNPQNKFVWDTSVCACDFRVNIHGCPEQEVYKIADWILIPYCLLLSIVASICLYQLIHVNKEPFFLPARSDRGFLRPRPQHTCYALALVYCPWKIIHMLQLLNDLYPNAMWAEIFQILPRTLAASFSILYPLSVLYSTGAIEIDTTLSSMGSMKGSLNLLKKIDITCISIMLSPLVIFLPLAGMTGHYADIGNIGKANKYFIAHNICWAVWGIFYIGAMVYFWSRIFPSILENVDLTMNNEKNPELELKLEQFKQNRDKITIPGTWQLIPACIYIFALVLYGALHRTNTIFIYGINIAYLIIWQYSIPIAIHISQWVMIYNTYVAKIPGSKLRGNSIVGPRRDGSDTTIHCPATSSSTDFGEIHLAMSSSFDNSLSQSPIAPKRNLRQSSYHSFYVDDAYFRSKKAEWGNYEGSSPRHSINSSSDATTLNYRI
ncbi:3473_t:CDS:2 [Funneliformis caledonium]|uniref:3473_t:CDS:1 n=1 Tax=Funneliformis caledonium TaxID=1117310 RepID=A0A9N9F5F3_9GLOM|nr:3473_t:CDS:2 [Funneliformis caledonium]